MVACTTILAGLTLLAVIAVAIDFARGNRSLRRLRDSPPSAGPDAPRVSIIVAARNEGRHLESAVRSMLGQSYPDLELVAVNDRSTDETGPILDRLAAQEVRLRVVHVQALPAGWLGKNYAHHRGAAAASGAWLLFTDGDIHLAPDTLSRAVQHARANDLAHLAIAPRATAPGLVLEMFVGAFTLFFGLYARPWKARDPHSARHIGLGAFNLVRADAYRAAGTHERIRLRVDDDVKLGKIIKDAGYAQEMLLGGDSVQVEWYATLGDLVRGLEKNSFAGVEFRVSAVVVATLAQCLAFLWPVLALALTTGPTRLLNALSVLVLAWWYVDNARFHGLKRWHVIGFPAMVVLFLYIIWRSTILTLWRGGIEWRGTRYPLAEMKRNRV